MVVGLSRERGIVFNSVVSVNVLIKTSEGQTVGGERWPSGLGRWEGEGEGGGLDTLTCRYISARPRSLLAKETQRGYRKRHASELTGKQREGGRGGREREREREAK